MKPIQPHKDSRITNISFDNFTGSICIITPTSDDDEAKNLMLSPPQTNGGADLFKPNHHLALITQPLLGARSRKKDKTDSLINSRRNSCDDSPSLFLPINRVEKFHYEKKSHHHESSDSGLDFSLSTNSSVQYPQPHPTIHRPLSALNEDSNPDDGFQEQPIRRPAAKPGHYNSMENVIHENHSNSSSKEQDKRTKKSNDDSHLDTIIEDNQPTNFHRMTFLPPSVSIQQHRSLNDLTNTTQTILSKPLRKKSKLNIIIEPSLSLSSSSHLNLNDEQLYSTNRITSSRSSSQTTSHLIRTETQQIKSKAITPLGHYPNPEQIRAHINRSVLERHPPPYLPIPTRKGFLQQNQPFDMTLSKVNHLLLRQAKPATTIFRSNPNIHGNSSTIQNLHPTSFRQSKQILPDLHHEEILDDRQKKRRFIEINKWQENPQKEHIRTKVKDIQEPLKTNRKRENRQDHLDNFLTSTPRRQFEHGQATGTNFKGQNTNQRQPPMNPTHRSKPAGFVIHNKTRIMNEKTEYSPRNTITPFQSHSKKLLRIRNTENSIEQIHQANSRQRSPAGSLDKLLRNARMQPMNMNNFRPENGLSRLSNIHLTQPNKEQKIFNRLFPTRSPTSWSILSDNQSPQQQDDHPYKSSSISPSTQNEMNNDQSNRTYRLNPTDDQQLPDGRYVIPADHSQRPTFADSSSQTSSRHTHPFTCTPDSNNNDDNSSPELIVLNNTDNLVDRRSCSSFSLDHFSPKDRFPLPLGRLTVAMEEDNLSTHKDSDDGWSDDSAELIYVDERYVTQKKKKNSSSSSSSSSHLISKQQRSHHYGQQ